MKHLTVFSDASFHESGAAGYAFFVRDDQKIIKRSFPLKWKAESSTDAETFAMCHAILHAIDNLECSSGDRIVAATDCDHVIQQFERQRSVTARSVLAILEDAGLSIIFKHVRAHTGCDDKRSYVNRWCDIQARREMRKLRRGGVK